MASEYLKWKYRDVTPDAPPPPLSRKQKRINWLRYHWLWLAAGAVVLAILGSMVSGVMGLGKTKADYTVAYIGRNELPLEAVEALEQGFAALGTDVNGDGRVVVTLNQYATGRGGDPETALYYNYAADARLVADLTAGDSYFFLVEDPDAVQRIYQLFARWDGTPPEEGDSRALDKVILWADCPALRSVAQEAPLSGLYLGRRCFYDEKMAAKQAPNDSLWMKIMEGVTP